MDGRLMPEELVHEGSRSLWDGSFKALCGVKMPSGTGKSVWFGKTTCPGCIAAKKP
ncbi:hypothetical protein ACIRG5_42420 [Lentzea sp. NPDC102401]|uniref:hypothetical protein n=1 Tax=Lentzea sp. NPDC102401 TaxID=3364128 RepID=UPI00380CD1F0